MRIAFVVQRYGQEVNGGAEAHCRMLVQRLIKRPEVDTVSVFTTCALHYDTWENHFPSGTTRDGNVTIHRFPSVITRQRSLQSALSPLVRKLPLGRQLDGAWIRAQGPYVPTLTRELSRRHDDFDVFVFFTYLYYPTVMGLPRVANKALLIPTAHDEPPIYQRIFRRVFESPRAIAYNTIEEKQFVEKQFRVGNIKSEIVGCGVDITVPPPAASANPDGLSASSAAPYMIYLGRIDQSKGVHRLCAAFAQFRRDHAESKFIARDGRGFLGRDLRLLLAGRGDVPGTDADPQIERLGFVADNQKVRLLQEAEVLALPSHFESLSLVMLEAWTLSTPVIVDGTCEVTKGHVDRCGGGRHYIGANEFGRGLSALLRDPKERDRAAASGKAYVEETYGWKQVEDRFLGLARHVAGDSRGKRAEQPRRRLRVFLMSLLPVIDRGGQVNLMRLIDNLDPEEFEIAVGCTEEGPLLDAARSRDLRVISGGLPGLRTARFGELLSKPRGFAQVMTWRKQLKAFDPDVVYADPVQFVGPLRLAVGPGPRIVWHAQTAFPSEYDRGAVRASDAVVAVSKSVVARLAGSGATPEVVHNGVDSTRFMPGMSRELRVEEDLADNEPLFLYVGSIETLKGVFELQEAFASVRTQLGKGTLWIVGTGTDEHSERLRQQATELGITAHVKAWGSQRDMPRFFGAADLFVFPSHAEGLPLALLEAMASGLPCVASDVLGNREALGPDGQYHRVKDATDLAATWLALAERPESWPALGHKARERAVTEFGVNAYVESFAKLFRRMGDS